MAEYSPHSPENGAAVRRRTRFPLLPGHFPAAAILFRGFLDFRSILEINGRRGPDTRKGRNRLRLPQVGRACFVVCLGLASLALRFAVLLASLLASRLASLLALRFAKRTQLASKPAGIRTTRRQRDSQSVLPLTPSRPATSRLLVLQRAGSSFPAGS